MDRGVWQATVHGSQRLRHGLVTEKGMDTIIFVFLIKQYQTFKTGKVHFWKVGKFFPLFFSFSFLIVSCNRIITPFNKDFEKLS